MRMIEREIGCKTDMRIKRYRRTVDSVNWEAVLDTNKNRPSLPAFHIERELKCRRVSTQSLEPFLYLLLAERPLQGLFGARQSVRFWRSKLGRDVSDCLNTRSHRCREHRRLSERALFHMWATQEVFELLQCRMHQRELLLNFLDAFGGVFHCFVIVAHGLRNLKGKAHKACDTGCNGEWVHGLRQVKSTPRASSAKELLVWDVH